MKPIPIVGAGAVYPGGFGWRRLAELPTHPGDAERRVDAPWAIRDRKQEKMMSRAAILAAGALVDLEQSSGTAPTDETALFLGVGASGCPLSDLDALVSRSMTSQGFSIRALGTSGLSACSPLIAFHLMNNFTLCHAAIQAGLRGPSSAFFSRGAGTVVALHEAIWSLRDGSAKRAIVGGADTAHHPVTRDELKREGHAITPSEGAAVLSLDPTARTPLAFVHDVKVGLQESEIRKFIERPSVGRLIVTHDSPTTIVDASQSPHTSARDVFGSTLAAGPALGWSLALAAVAGRPDETAGVLSIGLEGQSGLVTFRGGRP